MKKACLKIGAGMAIALFYRGAYAVDVYIADPSHPAPGKLCNGFSDMTSSPNRIDLSFTQDCIGTNTGNNGTPQVVNHSLSVSGGSSATVNVSDGATVKLPLPADAVDFTSLPDANKGSVTKNGAVVTYSAKATESPTSDSFQYRLKDATGSYSASATVNVSIAAGGGGGSGNTCQSGGNIICKGDDAALENGGTITQFEDIAADQIHVWGFTYKDITNTGYSSVSPLSIETTVDLEFTINQNAGNMDDATSAVCKRKKNWIGLTNKASYASYYCLLEVGTHYFLNVHNLSGSGSYTIIR